MTVEVRRGARGGADAADDRDFIHSLGRRVAGASISGARPCPPEAAAEAFDRLYSIVANQSLRTFIAHDAGRRVGFLLLLDSLPDEVTLIDQGFVAYMAVEPESRRAGIGAALLAAGEDEARRQGLPYMALMVTEENAAARGLYEGAGYFTERRLLCKRL